MHLDHMEAQYVGQGPHGQQVGQIMSTPYPNGYGKKNVSQSFVTMDHYSPSVNTPHKPGHRFPEGMGVLGPEGLRHEDPFCLDQVPPYQVRQGVKPLPSEQTSVKQPAYRPPGRVLNLGCEGVRYGSPPYLMNRPHYRGREGVAPLPYEDLYEERRPEVQPYSLTGRPQGLDRNQHTNNSLLFQGAKKIKPPNYDGRFSFKDFLVQFELVAQLAGWHPSVMALELAGSLRGTAIAVLSDLQPSERTHYPTLVRALMDRFEPENQKQLYKAQLKSRYRRMDESIPELAQEINRLVRGAYVELPPDLRDGMAKDAFIDALNNRDLELAVFQSQARTLQQAVKVAMEFEAFQSTRPRKVASVVRECTVEHKDETNDDLSRRIGQLEDELCSLRVSKDSRGNFSQEKQNEPRGKALQCFV